VQALPHEHDRFKRQDQLPKECTLVSVYGPSPSLTLLLTESPQTGGNVNDVSRGLRECAAAAAHNSLVTEKCHMSG
jgi:hypothetical protein